jgi:hypothetical protein
MENDFYFLEWCFPSLNKKTHLKVYVLDLPPRSQIVLARTQLVERVIF